MTRTLLALLASFLLFASLGCSSSDSNIKKLAAKTEPTDLKILIVGVDGATFSVVDPLIAQGKLPQFKALMNSGASGILKSDPPMSSPAIWTSIVTGKRREVHGIRGFLRGTGTPTMEKTLVTSNDRDVTAVWNWLGPFGKTVGFLGWWASWPAEPVNGWIVSDRITRSRWAEWYDGQKNQQLTFPAELLDQIQDLVVDPMQPPMNEINEMVDLTAEESHEFLAARKPVLFHGLSVFKFAYCHQRTYEHFALRLIDTGQRDLTGVFLIAADPICHTFWHYYEPEKYAQSDPAVASRLGRLIPAIYEHNDRFLSQLLTKIDENTVVFVLSDHGFQSTGTLPREVPIEQFDALKSEAMRKGTVAVGQSGDHHLDGVLIARGPWIREGVTVEANVFDIAPTILALMGLPVPEDMEGRVLTEMIKPSFFEKHPIVTIRSFEDYFDREKLVITDSVNQDEIMERLRSLGYVK